MTTTSSFHSVYRLARLNRGNLHFRGQLFRFGNNAGNVYISTTGQIVIGRVDSNDPGFYASFMLRGPNSLKTVRRHFIERARDCGPVPLP